MGQNASNLTANGLLLGTSILCLNRCSKRMKYARTCFKMYAGIAVLRIITCFSWAEELGRIDEITWVWCYVFGIPLLATDLSQMSPYAPDLSALHLFIPIYTILAFHVCPEKVDALLLTVSHSLSTMILAISSVSCGSLCGLGISYIHFRTIFSLNAPSDAKNYWTLMMTLSNILAFILVY